MLRAQLRAPNRIRIAVASRLHHRLNMSAHGACFGVNIHRPICFRVSCFPILIKIPSRPVSVPSGPIWTRNAFSPTETGPPVQHLDERSPRLFTAASRTSRAEKKPSGRSNDWLHEAVHDGSVRPLLAIVMRQTSAGYFES